MFEKFVVPLSSTGWKSLAKKTVLGLATGAARIAMTGEGSLSVKLGSDYANVGLGFTKTKDGGWSVSAAAQLGAPISPFGTLGAIAGKYEYKHNADGTTTRTASGSTSEGQGIGFGGVAARQSESSSTTTDKSGHEQDKSTSGSQVLAAEPGAGHQSNTTTTTKSEAGKPTKTEQSHVEGSRLLGDSWGAPL